MIDSNHPEESMPQANRPESDVSEELLFTGITGWLVYKHPWTLPFLSFVGCSLFAVVMLLTNPAGNSTSGDDYGPSAPLQPWVVVSAGLLVVSALLSLVLLVMVILRKFTNIACIDPSRDSRREKSP